MILYTGGRYQGKLENAEKDYRFKSEDIVDFRLIDLISDNELVNAQIAGKKVWYHTEDYIRHLAFSGYDIEDITIKVTALYENAKPDIVIVSEVGAGVIPIEKEENIYREATGRMSVIFSEKAEHVYRVVCGLKMSLK